MPMEKTFNAAEAEARIAKLWDEARAFRAGANARPRPDGSPAEAFSIVIPPPNVTGSLHMGHAFNNTLQDILTRWHRMRGHDTLWQPGTDHAGIATQMVTERDMALHQEPDRRTMGREAFVARVWQQKAASRGTIIGQLKRLGASCDWSREAFTMSGAPGAPAGEDGNFHDAVIKVFVDLYNKGLIYRGKRLVNWDPHFETAISDLEVEQTEVDGHMWHFKYPLAGGATYDYIERDADGIISFRETRDYISIATTRPETMLGDGAVAVHPSDTRYAPIVGHLCEIPVGPKQHRRLIPIITDEYPDPNFGSGAVKITGAHDFNDYGVATRNGIPLYRLMDTKAQMRSDGVPYAEAAATAQAMSRAWLVRKGYATPGFAEQPLNPSEGEIDALNLVPDDLRGLDRYEARKRVVAQIEAEGLSVMTRADDPRLGKSATKPQPRPGPDPGPLSDPGTAPGEEVPGQARDEREPVPLIEAKKIMQPHGDRSKVVIEPMLTDQWFVDTAKIVQPAIDAVRDGRTRILPEQHEKVYFHWLENIEPWCISRQLWWGHQIPVWYGPNPNGLPLMEAFHKATRLMREHPSDPEIKEKLSILADEVGTRTAWFDGNERVRFCAPTEADALAQAKEVYGDRWYAKAANESEGGGFHPDAARGMAQTSGLYWFNDNTDLVGVSLVRDPDVLDTWFSSGLWPIGTLGWPEDTPELKRYFPTSVLVTGFDIIFFWVARMMMMQLAVVGDIPFRTVYVHALVRDEKGKKMSKSLGNVLDPLDLIGEFGADAVRFTLAAMAAMGRDLKLSKDRIAGYRNFATKLWNATRFAEMNGVFAAPRMYASHTDAIRMLAPVHTVNRWIMGETAKTRIAVDEALEGFRFNDAANALYAFVWGRVCDWYVEFAKPLMDGPEAPETRATMAWVLDQCCLMLHPFMPFITEDLWAQTGRTGLLAHGDWPAYGAELIDETADAEMTWVIALIEEIRSARAEMGVPAGAKLDMLQYQIGMPQLRWLKTAAPLIERLARVNVDSVDLPGPGEDIARGVVFVGRNRGAISISVEAAEFGLFVAGIIDVAAEKSRLSKAMEKLQKEIAGLAGRVNNPRFAASAPPDVVEEARENLALRQAEASKITAALTRLADIV